MTVTVLEQAKGLFGKGSIRIRAEAAEAAPEPAAKPAKEAKAAPAPKEEKPKAAPKGRGRGKAEKVEAEPEPEPEKAAPAKASRAPKAAAPVAAADDEDAGGDAPVATDADAKEIEALVREMLDSSGLQVTVAVRGVQSRYVNIELDGRDAAFLIGKHGEVLNAMQYLANIIAGRQLANGVRATLDGNNYRRRREEALTKYAMKIADQVADRGEEAVLDALPAFERRIVLKALAERGGVQTYSEGEEPNRRVVIAPAE